MFIVFVKKVFINVFYTFNTFIDNYSSFWVVSLLKRKSNAFDTFKNYKVYAENLFG